MSNGIRHLITLHFCSLSSARKINTLAVLAASNQLLQAESEALTGGAGACKACAHLCSMHNKDTSTSQMSKSTPLNLPIFSVDLWIILRTTYTSKFILP